jgi:hypothetical protein
VQYLSIIRRVVEIVDFLLRRCSEVWDPYGKQLIPSSFVSQAVT